MVPAQPWGEREWMWFEGKLREAFLPKGLWSCKRSSLNEHDRAVFEELNAALPQLYSGGGTVIVTGEPGSGKTHFAALLVKASVLHELRTIRFEFPSFLDEVRDRSFFDGDNRFLDVARSTQVVVFDTVASKFLQSRGFAEEELVALCNERVYKPALTILVVHSPEDARRLWNSLNRGVFRPLKGVTRRHEGLPVPPVGGLQDGGSQNNSQVLCSLES